MRSRPAIVRTVGGTWSVEEFELDPPRAGEVLVQMAAAGLCHSDDHIRNGFMAPRAEGPPSRPPTIGGHEGSGVVLEVGGAVTGLAPGDHVVTSFVAVCGHCRWCASGMEYLCDKGAGVLPGGAGVLPGGNGVLAGSDQANGASSTDQPGPPPFVGSAGVGGDISQAGVQS